VGDVERYRRKRDFASTPEPSGEGDAGTTGPDATARRFVVQKHAARRTHFDLRLEIGGRLVSWAVPKGPSADPATKRLAVHVEDHPLEYGGFEGTIPEGEYGAGPVIVWDRGRYQPTGETEDSDEALERGLRDGKLEFVLYGERLRGRWSLVRMKAEAGEDNWLLLKKKDLYAEPGRPEALVERYRDSVVSGRTLDELSSEVASARRDEAPAPPVDVRPMLAAAADRAPSGEAWCFELKFDGIRAVAWARPSGPVQIYSRRGGRSDTAFPEIAEALELLARRSGSEFVVDGEIVAARAKGAPRFQDLGPRLHLRDPVEIARQARARPAEMAVFDLLWLDGADLRDLPLSERKARLRSLLAAAGHRLYYVPHEVAAGDAAAERARRDGFEGVVAKRVASRYRSGERTRDWLKVKQLARQEFVIAGWTDPKGGRRGFGALVLGYYEAPGGERLRCAGRVGSGFSDETLGAIWEKLAPMAQPSAPFAEVPNDLCDAHWVRPELVAEVKFQGWTRDGRLREPVFLGLRPDVDPRQVVREESLGAPTKGPPVTLDAELVSLIRTLEALERDESDGELTVGRCRLKATNLRKTFWPDVGVTKGELFRYYVSVAPAILPALRDRPLTLERYPDGITGERFYQQRVPGPVPDGVRTVTLEVEGEEGERLIGGDLPTLLYAVQLAAITQHIWPSRLGSLEELDYCVLDLDPGEGVPFSAVQEAALAVREQLERLGLRGYPKTSGATGVHVIIPLGPGTSYETGRLLAELIANLVVRSRPDLATVERAVARRGARVYLDFLQNRRGATIASAYSTRPRPGATVSAPLGWDELERDVRPEEFTVRTMRERLASVGDVWALCRGDANDVREVLDAFR
jgi:bifunctional non-homologous end joining protein LigD